MREFGTQIWRPDGRQIHFKSNPPTLMASCEHHGLLYGLGSFYNWARKHRAALAFLRAVPHLPPHLWRPLSLHGRATCPRCTLRGTRHRHTMSAHGLPLQQVRRRPHPWSSGMLSSTSPSFDIPLISTCVVVHEHSSRRPHRSTLVCGRLCLGRAAPYGLRGALRSSCHVVRRTHQSSL